MKCIVPKHWRRGVTLPASEASTKGEFVRRSSGSSWRSGLKRSSSDPAHSLHGAEVSSNSRFITARADVRVPQSQ
jgi:hypothetical protein